MKKVKRKKMERITFESPSISFACMLRTIFCTLFAPALCSYSLLCVAVLVSDISLASWYVCDKIDGSLRPNHRVYSMTIVIFSRVPKDFQLYSTKSNMKVNLNSESNY